MVTGRNGVGLWLYGKHTCNHRQFFHRTFSESAWRAQDVRHLAEPGLPSQMPFCGIRWQCRHDWICSTYCPPGSHPTSTQQACITRCIYIYPSRFASHYICKREQEGQHPLTGQRDANFRLLANQWAECRLATQWRHSCRAMRRSVCNAGASNAGQSVCIQISREWSYPLPIYWYHSKGNWLHYNLAVNSFYIMELYSRLFVLYCWNCPKDDKFRYFITILKKLGAV